MAAAGRDEGLVEDVACLVASWARRRPWSALALCVGATWLAWRSIELRPSVDAVALGAGAVHLGAALLSRRRGRTGSGSRPWVRWLFVGALAEAALLVGLHLMWRPADPWTAGIAVAAVMAGVGWARPNLLAPLAVVVLAFAMWREAAEESDSWFLPLSTPLQPLWLLGSLVAFLVAARWRQWTWVIPVTACAAAAITWHGYIDRFRLPTFEYYRWAALLAAASVAPLFAPVIAARAAAQLDDAPSASIGTRLLVRLHLAPWATATAIALLAVWSIPWIPLRYDRAASLVPLAVGVALAQIAGTWTSPFDRLAAWLAVTALGAAAALYFESNYRAYEPLAVVAAMTLAYAPLVVGVVASAGWGARSPWWGCAALAATLLLDGQVDEPLQWAAWCVALSIVLHAVATSSISSRTAFLLSPVLPVVAVGFTLSTWADVPFRNKLTVESFLAGPIAVALVLFARRVRSMTAVPADHAAIEPRPLPQVASAR